MSKHQKSNEELTFWDWDGRVLVASICILLLFGVASALGGAAESKELEMERLEVMRNAP